MVSEVIKQEPFASNPSSGCPYYRKSAICFVFFFHFFYKPEPKMKEPAITAPMIAPYFQEIGLATPRPAAALD